MPPKRTRSGRIVKAAGEGPFKTAEGFYKAAYRARIRVLRNTWIRPQIESTLAWLWRNASIEEKGDCEERRRSKSTQLPATNDARIPAHPKTRLDPAPAVPQMVGGHRVNTTNFCYMPSGADVNADLGERIDGHLEGNQNTRARNRWLRLPTAMRDANEEMWHGVRFLGEGGYGRVGLWVQTNEDNSIVDRMAVKETTRVTGNWCSPFRWRDRLPMPIAIQERIRSQGGHPNLHGYRGYRLNMRERRYRLYNDLCKYGDVLHAFNEYAQNWLDRRAAHRNNELVSEELPPTIPERFLWYFFSALIDACIFLEEGSGRDGREWREIVHGDIHIQNIFLRDPDDDDAQKAPGEGDEVGEHDDEAPAGESSRGAGESSSAAAAAPKTTIKWPVPVLADFDLAMFDLRARGDVYRDNPVEYVSLYSSAVENQRRYPPDKFINYYEHAETRRHQLNSRTNVWGIGMVMWNMLVNMPGERGYLQEPWFDDLSRPLINGERYTAEIVQDRLLTGREPFAAAGTYSEAIRRLTKRCLAYVQDDRPTLRQLRERVQHYIDDPPDDMDRGNAYFTLNNPESLDEFRRGQVYQRPEEEGEGEGGDDEEEGHEEGEGYDDGEGHDAGEDYDEDDDVEALYS